MARCKLCMVCIASSSLVANVCRSAGLQQYLCCCLIVHSDAAQNAMRLHPHARFSAEAMSTFFTLTNISCVSCVVRFPNRDLKYRFWFRKNGSHRDDVKTMHASQSVLHRICSVCAIHVKGAHAGVDHRRSEHDIGRALSGAGVPGERSKAFVSSAHDSVPHLRVHLLFPLMLRVPCSQ